MVVLNFTTGSDPLGLAQYLLNPDKQKDATGTVVATNMGGRDASELAEEFRFIHDLRPKVKHFMRHLSLSFAPGEQVEAEQFRRTVQRLLELTKHDRCPYFAVRHHDQEHKHGVEHGHIAVCAIGWDGSRVSDSNILRRLKQEDRSIGRSIERQLEIDCGLVVVEVRPEAEQRNLTTGEYRLKERTGKTLPKEKLWDAIDQAATDQPTMPILVARLKANAVEVRFSEFEDGGRGLSFGIDGKQFQGRSLAKAYSFGGLQQHRGVSYQADQDDGLLRQLTALSADDCRSWLAQQAKQAIDRDHQQALEQAQAFAQSQALAQAQAIETERQSYQALYDRYAVWDGEEALSAKQRDVLVAWQALEDGQPPIEMVAILGAGSERAQQIRQQQGRDQGLEYLKEVITKVLAERDPAAERTSPQPAIAPDATRSIESQLQAAAQAFLEFGHQRLKQQKQNQLSTQDRRFTLTLDPRSQTLTVIDHATAGEGKIILQGNQTSQGWDIGINQLTLEHLQYFDQIQLERQQQQRQQDENRDRDRLASDRDIGD